MSIPVDLAIEDELSEAVLRRLLDYAKRGYSVGTAYGRGGYGYLKKTIPVWNKAAKYKPFVILTDLDQRPCASALIAEWLRMPQHPNLLLRIAVREVEAWLLADRTNLANFLHVPEKHIPVAPEQLMDPKQAMIEVARRSKLELIRQRIVPKKGSTATQGREYNACLCEFVSRSWSIPSAMAQSPSLERTVLRLKAFTPKWE